MTRHTDDTAWKLNRPYLKSDRSGLAARWLRQSSHHLAEKRAQIHVSTVDMPGQPML